MKLKKGSILISEPYSKDPNFDWTVIQLCDHTEEGTYGFVLNDKSDLMMRDVLEDFHATDFPIYYGGPVEMDSLFYIHKIKDLRESSEVCEGIFVHGDFNELKARIALGEVGNDDVRFFLGYSGWDNGQLEGEIKNRSWFVNNSHINKVIDMEVDNLWRNILKEMGGKYKQYANFPINPTEN